MSKINCFKNIGLPIEEKFNSLINDSMSEREEKIIGFKLVKEYYIQLHLELNALKKDIALKEDKLLLPKELNYITSKKFEEEETLPPPTPTPPTPPSSVEDERADIETPSNEVTINDLEDKTVLYNNEAITIVGKPVLTAGVFRFDAKKQGVLLKNYVSIKEEEANDHYLLYQIGKQSKPIVNKPKGRGKKAFRIANKVENVSPEQWNNVESFIKRILPNIPLYRVKNIIEATNGKQAWGMFHKVAIYLYEQAEVGTIYHEAFEAIWGTFVSPEEKLNVANDFKQRQGSFIDNEGNIVNYKDATEEQMKEEVAEEFRTFVMENDITAPKTLLGRLFKQLVDFIREFFVGKNAAQNTQELFDKIGSGYYAKYSPFERINSFIEKGTIDINNIASDENSVFRLKPNIPSKQLKEVVDDMIYNTISSLFEKQKNVFSVQAPNMKELNVSLKANIEENIDDLIAEEEGNNVTIEGLKTLKANIDKEWKAIFDNFKIRLKFYSVSFDENDDLTLDDENKSGKSDWQNARKIDTFKKSNSIIKLLLATVPELIEEEGELYMKRSSVGGAILSDEGSMFFRIMNEVHSSISPEEMMNRLKDMAKEDAKFALLYRRLTNNSLISEPLDYNSLKKSDLDLMMAFYVSMKKQKPDIITVHMLENGEIVISDSTLDTAAKQAKAEMASTLISTIRNNRNPYIEYRNKKYFVVKNINKASNLNPSIISTYTNFLKDLGITGFSPMAINKRFKNSTKKKEFFNAVDGIVESLSEIRGMTSVNIKTLDIDGHLLKLGALKAILENPDFNSTYFDLNGEQVQAFIPGNATNSFHETISTLDNIEDVRDTQYAYLLTDEFSQGSVMLNRIFNINTDGERRANTEHLMKPVIIDGTDDQKKGKKNESSRLTKKQRLVQEINLNIDGVYLNLVPGDASIEHGLRMHTKKTAFIKSGDYDADRHLDVFKDYFIAEVNLARDDRKNVYVKEEKNRKQKTKDLRFFKGILGDALHNEIIKDRKSSPEDLYENNKKAIDKAVNDFIEEDAEETRVLLDDFNATEDVNLPIGNFEKNLKLLSINYMIANIELHKLIYSDPYLYNDELKRTKLFVSPKQMLVANSLKVNVALNNAYNEGYDKDDIGYTDMTRDHFTSITADDIDVEDELYEEAYNETDGGGKMLLKARRVFDLRTSQWNDDKEKQYRYDVAYEKVVKELPLTKEEKAFNIRKVVDEKTKKVKYVGKNPGIKSTYVPLKPSVAGNKQDGNNYNDIVVDKLALETMSFRILHEMNPESNALKLYNKMQKEDVDYLVFTSGRKAGGTITHSLYTNEAKFNNAEFEMIHKIPFSIIGLQAEVPSKEGNNVTQGSQITKMATMDFMEAGVPIDYNKDGEWDDRFAAWTALTDEEKITNSPLYKEIENNRKLLEERLDVAYTSMLRNVNIKNTDEGWEISDKEKLVNLLKEQVLGREVNNNIIDALEGFNNGSVILEATPAYRQIKNILYSIADKNIVRPKMNGGQKVQVSSALLESNREIKRVEGKKKTFTSNILKFYRNADGERVAEIMVGRWFKSNMSDEELLKYFNDTEEGQKILKGIAFRIPTQKQNSIDVFKIAKFLPKEYGDSVVVPSALVAKVGSDFDIDKLSIYFKNIFTNKDGKPEMIPYFGIGSEAIQSITIMYDLGDFNEFINSKKELLSIEDSAENRLMQSMFPEEYSTQRDDVINDIYKKSLENGYIESLENLVGHELNFENLVKANSAQDMIDIKNDVIAEMGVVEDDATLPSNMLRRAFMSDLRHSFVSGKYSIGIAAVGQANHAQNQRGAMYVSNDLSNVEDDDVDWLGGNTDSDIYATDTKINFKEYNTIKVNGTTYASLSGIKNKAGKYISDIIGMFIDGYVDVTKDPWVMKLGAAANTVGTWLFLAKIGVPIKTVAYFMNQPIIRDYLKTIENNGYSWLFIEDFVKLSLNKYSTKEASPTEIPSEKELFEMLKYNKEKGKMSEKQRAQQQYILKEFLKYSKMANHLFLVTQGSNFDTANLNDHFLIYKKTQQYLKAKNTIISSVDKLIEGSFVNTLKNILGIDANNENNVRDAFTSIMISDRPRMRTLMEQVLAPYVNTNDRNFVKISQKAVNDVFDWAVHTNKINLEKILLTDPESYAEQIIDFKNSLPENSELKNNLVLQNLIIEKGEREGRPDNIKLKAKENKVYNQNLIIGAFEEIKDNAPTDVYKKLVSLIMAQSGLTNSPISLTSLLPYEDFKEEYNEILSSLEEMETLGDFYTLHVFERNNWNNTDVVAKREAFTKQTVDEDYNPRIKNLDTAYNLNSLKNAMRNGTIPKTIAMSRYSRSGKSDFITYTWTDDISPTRKEEMRRQGDFSYYHRALMKKVYNTDGSPLIIHQYDEYTGTTFTKYVYTAINAWGSSFRAQEFYTEEHQSIFDNGYEKVNKSVNDNVIINIVKKSKDKNIHVVTNKSQAKVTTMPNTNKPQGLPSINRSPKKC